MAYKGSDERLEKIYRALDEIGEELGSPVCIGDVTIAELSRRTGMTQGRIRRALSHGERNAEEPAKRHRARMLDRYSGKIDAMLLSGISNSAVVFRRLRAIGYEGGMSTVRAYVSAHRDLIPRRSEAPDPGERARRYQTEPGDAFQMDWGFAKAVRPDGAVRRLACFAMVCHRCGTAYAEFFPNARQESLFAGAVRAFDRMGVPRRVITDNMRSVVIRRGLDGRPIWQADWEAFMKDLSFETTLCRPRHPYTKGKVERLIRTIKEGFLMGVSFLSLADLNRQAMKWLEELNGDPSRGCGMSPAERHLYECMPLMRPLERSRRLMAWLCPRRSVSRDGFVEFEGRRYGVPLWYGGAEARVCREGGRVMVLSADLSAMLAEHDAESGGAESAAPGQFALPECPEERPTAPVTAMAGERPDGACPPGFERFAFGAEWED